MTQSKLTEKLKKLGFHFTQSEFCTKGTFYVCLDCYPYLIESGKHKSLWFKTWKEFISFYRHYA